MLKSFCCMRLNTAAIVIGWLGAAFSFLLTILVIFPFVKIDEIKYEASRELGVDLASARMILIIIFTVYLALNVINLTASVLLVAGTMKERHLMLMPWLINSGISLAFSGLYVLGAISKIFTSYDTGMAIFQTILTSINFAIQFYFWFAIYSFYKQLQANKEQQRLVGLNQPHSHTYTKIECKR